MLADDDRRLLAYVRTWEGEAALVAFNASEEAHTADIAIEGSFKDALAPETIMQSENGQLTLDLPPRTAMILIRG